jgi:hypothetical protein
MSEGFGGEAPHPHVQSAHRRPARFLVVIESAGVVVARLFLASREQVAEFDAGQEEVVQMMAGVAPVTGAGGPEWDRALAGHTADERAAAEVYALPL